MKKEKPAPRDELHIIMKPELLKRLRIDAIEEELSIGKLVQRIIEDYYTK